MDLRDRVPPARTALAAVFAVAVIGGAATYANVGASSAPELYDHGTLGVSGEPVADADAAVEGNHFVVVSDPAAAAALAERPDVTRIAAVGDGSYAITTTLDAAGVAAVTGTEPEPDVIGTLGALDVPDPYAPWQWALENTGQELLGTVGTPGADVDAGAAFAAGHTGAGTVVAVVDTGVNFGHQDLAHAKWTNTDENCNNGVDDDVNGYVDDCDGWDFANNDRTQYDGPSAHFHGTHVASIIAARHDNVGMAGIAPGAKIMALKVSDQASLQMSAVAAAVRYAVTNGADVINLSLGGNGVSTPLKTAIDLAEANGVTVVAAAGNSTENVDVTGTIPVGYTNPNVIGVANSAQNDALAASSSYGAASVDLAAPGENIIGGMPNGAWAYASGTSMAAPLVAGAAALLLAQQPSLSPTLVRTRLIATAEDLPAFTSTTVSGGRMDVAALLGLADPDDPGPSAPPASDMVTFDGFGSATHETSFDSDVIVRAPSAAPMPYRVEGQLLSLDGPTAAIQAHPVTVGSTPTITDTLGMFDLTAVLAPSAHPELGTIPLRLQLPEGRYGLVVSLVSGDDPTTLVAEQSSVIFEVGPVSGGTPGTPTTAAPTTTAPGSSPTTAPATTVPGSPTTVPGSPTTVPSGPSNPTTTVPEGPGGQTSTTTTTVPGSPVTTAPGGAPTSTVPAPVTTVAPATTVAPTTTVAPATTTPPTTAAPTTTAPPTTAAPTTTTVPSPPVTVPSDPADPVSDGPWSITSITPNHCAVNTACRVTIRGTFPRVPNVWFGSVVVPSTSVSGSSTTLQLTVPASVTAGVVDVALRDHDVNLVQPGGFTFTGGGGSPGSSTTTTTTVAPGNTNPPATTTTVQAPGSSTTVAPSTPTTFTRTLPTVGASTTRNGLTVAELSAPPSIVAMTHRTDSCTMARCGGRTV